MFQEKYSHIPKCWESQNWKMKYRCDIISQTSESPSPPPSSHHLCSGLDQAWPHLPYRRVASPASSRAETLAIKGFTQGPPPTQRSLPFPSEISLPLLSSRVIIICSHFLWFCLIQWHLSAYSINLSFSFHMRSLLFLLGVFSEHNMMPHS